MTIFDNLGDIGVLGETSRAEDLPTWSKELGQLVGYDKLDFMVYIRKQPNFISLDVSKTNTGWTKWLDGVLTVGDFSLKEIDGDNHLALRQAYKKELRKLFGEDVYEYVFIEDVTGSENFKTANILYQLNPIVDDMMYDGIIKVGKIIREDNKKWKRNLKDASNYTSQILADVDDKPMIVACCSLLGFGNGVLYHKTKNPTGYSQDTYDSMGIAIGCIYGMVVGVETLGTKVKIKNDIMTGYEIKQYQTKEEALKYVTKNGKAYQEFDLRKEKDIRKFFKAYIKTEEAMNGVYVVAIRNYTLSAVALKKGLLNDMNESYIVVYKKITRAKKKTE